MPGEQVYRGSGRGFVIMGVVLVLVGAANVVIGVEGREPSMVWGGGGLGLVGLVMALWTVVRPFRITIGPEHVAVGSQRIPLEHLIVGPIEWRSSGSARVRAFELQWVDASDRVRTRFVTATAFPNLEEIQTVLSRAAARRERNP